MKKRAVSCVVFVAAIVADSLADDHVALRAAINHAQRRVVKVYGAGGVRGLEGYRSGIVVGEAGLVLSIDGGLFESGEALVVTAEGDRYAADLEGVDPLTRVALLSIRGAESALPAFVVSDVRPPLTPGAAVLAISNAFNIATGNEDPSVQVGVIAALATVGLTDGGPPMTAHAPVLLVDFVTSNPGSAGGAVVDAEGRLIGMLGPEARSEATGQWINYALPVSMLVAAIERCGEGAEVSAAVSPPSPLPRLREYGVSLVPPVTPRTPPYVEVVRPGSPAERAGLRADDLIVLVGGMAVGTVDDAEAAILAAFARGATVEVTTIRGERLIEGVLSSN